MKIDLEALCEQVGVAFYDDELVSENGRKIYRVYIAKKGGVSLDECALLSELLSPMLDVAPPCEGEYALEVSSPGLERKLTKSRHFEFSVGEKAVLTLSDKSVIVGEILGVLSGENEAKSVLLLDENGKKIAVNLDEIKKAKTFVQW